MYTILNWTECCHKATLAHILLGSKWPLIKYSCTIVNICACKIPITGCTMSKNCHHTCCRPLTTGNQSQSITVHGILLEHFVKFSRVKGSHTHTHNYNSIFSGSIINWLLIILFFWLKSFHKRKGGWGGGLRIFLQFTSDFQVTSRQPWQWKN